MAGVSKEEYLKRYLSTDTSKQKKKKKKIKTIKQSNVRIIDDDVDIKMIPAVSQKADEDPEDEGPTVAEVVDERPQHVQRLEAYRKDQRWKVIGKQEEKDEITTKDYGVIATGRRRHDSDSSNSPPRRKLHNSDRGKSPLARKKGRNSESDPCPVRRQRHDSDSDTNTQNTTKRQPASPGPREGSHRHSGSPAGDSKVKRKRHDSGSDLSPPRMRPGLEFDSSPPRRSKRDSDSDQSPPRKNRHDSDSDQSPPRKQPKGESEDQSPCRKQRLDSVPDQSPPRRKRQDSDSDQSPPRKIRTDRSSDLSARKTKTANGSDQSPHQRKRHNSSDQSPPRRRRQDSSDQSPPRKRKVDGALSPQEQSNKAASNSAKPEKTLGGTKAGLSSAAEMKREAEKLKKKEEMVFSKIDKEALGRDAKTVFRDKSGKRRNLAEEQKEEEEEAKKKAAEDKKYEEWGKGMKQKELREQALVDLMHEASKPLARYKDDEDLDRMMRNMDREGDPMAMFIKKKKGKKEDLANEKPRYRGPPPPPNRYGIMPGYRWDGVDRSNGFEKQIFSKMSDQKAIKEHAYKWSTEDM